MTRVTRIKVDKKIIDEGGTEKDKSLLYTVVSIYIYYEVWRNIVNNNNSNHITSILLMNRDLLSTVRVYCLSIIAELSRVSFIIVPHVYIPALETCTSLSVRSNDKIKWSIINGSFHCQLNSYQ